jgi:hypothetical protein
MGGLNEQPKDLSVLEGFAKNKIKERYPNLDILIKKVENQFSFSFIRVNIDHYQGTLLFDSFDDLEDFVLEEKYEALLEFAEKDLKGGFSKN